MYRVEAADHLLLYIFCAILEFMQLRNVNNNFTAGDDTLYMLEA
jgi:hypothetical protein